MATRDRWQNALTALMGAKGVDPRAFYLARVLRGYDNAADLDPELDAFPPMSVIPVRTFAPGVIVKPQRGRLCLWLAAATEIDSCARANDCAQCGTNDGDGNSRHSAHASPLGGVFEGF